MILKFYETKKINLEVNKFLLLYGKNEGLKNQIIKDILSKKKNVFNYEEKEILDNSEIFIENLLTKSLFESEKVIIIKRSFFIKIILPLTVRNVEQKNRLESDAYKTQNTILLEYR